MAQILVYTAVPFSLGRMQTTALSAALRGCVGVGGNRERSDQSRNDEQSARKQKRMRLDHLTAEEKNHRRKLMNREAAQNARDKFNTRMSTLEKKVQQLKRERDVLLVQNESLKENCKKLENENLELLQATTESDTTSVSNKWKCISSEESTEDVLCTTSLLESSDNLASGKSLEQAEGAGYPKVLSIDDSDDHYGACECKFPVQEHGNIVQEHDVSCYSMHQQDFLRDDPCRSEHNVSSSELSQELDLIEQMICDDLYQAANEITSVYPFVSSENKMSFLPDSHQLGYCKDDEKSLVHKSQTDICSRDILQKDESSWSNSLCLQDLVEDFGGIMDFKELNFYI